MKKELIELLNLISRETVSANVHNVDMPSIEDHVKTMSMLINQYRIVNKLKEEVTLNYSKTAFTVPVSVDDIGQATLFKFSRLCQEIRKELDGLKDNKQIAINRISRRINKMIYVFEEKIENDKPIIRMRSKQDLRGSLSESDVLLS